MKIALDVHTHTLASGHAFSTLQEMARAAADKGLELLGITEHSPGIPGSCDLIYFRNLHVVPRRMYGIELLLGAEINILDGEGNLDLDEYYLQRLDLRIAGIHSLCYHWGTVEENTHGMVQAISNPYIHIISHPGDGTAELNFEPIVWAAKEHHRSVTNRQRGPIIWKFCGCVNNTKYRLFWGVTRISLLISPYMTGLWSWWVKRNSRRR